LILPVVSLLVTFLATVQGTAAQNLDEEVLDLISKTYTSPTLDDVMKGVSYLGSKDVGIPLCLALFILGGERTRSTGILSTASMAATSGVITLTRYVVDRDRPDGRDHARIRSSFPSGHAGGAFAVATVVAHKHPRYKILSYTAATAISVSRVYLRRHYPSDVLVGSAVGYVAGRLILRYEDKILGWFF
jgi:membrane-associated phospholipid phosphatase